jgi:hypothetical protein
MRARRFLASLVVLLGPTTAFAQAPATSTSKGPTIVADQEPELPIVPYARDTVGGHFQLGVAGLASAPFGELQNGYAAQDLGAGFGAAVDAGIGLNRALSFGLWGEGLFYGSSAACRFWHYANTPRDPCSGRSLSVGPFVRYHLVQGMRLDPWILVGTGYRSLTQDTPVGTKHYAGVEWLHVALGADYYVLSGFGFGPFLALDGGVFAKRPNPLFGEAAKTAWHTEFVAGLRIVLDVPGK